jgi:ankyrin repeat protein
MMKTALPSGFPPQSAAPVHPTTAETSDTTRKRSGLRRITHQQTADGAAPDPGVQMLHEFYGRLLGPLSKMQERSPVEARSLPVATVVSEPVSGQSRGAGTKRPRQAGAASRSVEPGAGAIKKPHIRHPKEDGHYSRGALQQRIGDRKRLAEQRGHSPLIVDVGGPHMNAEDVNDDLLLFRKLGQLGDGQLSAQEVSATIQQVQRLLENGARLPKTKSSGFFFTQWFLDAVRRADLVIATILWRAGAGSGIETSCSFQRFRALSILFESDGDESRQLQMAKALIELGCPVNVPDHYGIYPIHRVAALRRPSLVLFMLRQGANPNALDRDGRGPLFYANDAATINALIRQGAAFERRDLSGDTALVYAQRSQRPKECIDALENATARLADTSGSTSTHQRHSEVGRAYELPRLRREVPDRDISGETALMRAVKEGDAQMAALLIQHGGAVNEMRPDGSTPLMLAAESGRIPVVGVLLRAGANLHQRDESGQNALMRAAKLGYADVVKALIAAGAHLGQRTLYGNTVMGLAVAGGRIAVAEVLLAAGVDVNDTGSPNFTNLMLAAFAGHALLTGVLIRHGAQVNATNVSGSTPLMYAARGGHKQTVKMLLLAGADMRTVNSRGETALTLAGAGSNAGVLDLLVRHGADFNS